MICRNAREIHVIASANRLRSFEMRKRVFIILRFKFAQTEKSPCRAYLRRENYEFLQSRDRFRVVIGVVLERPEIPPALLPIRADCDRPLVILNGNFNVVSVACRGGRFREIVEAVACTLFGRLRTSLREYAESENGR